MNIKTIPQFILSVLFVTIFTVQAHSQASITTGTLLKELINREAIPEYPVPYYVSKQYSSYDRNAKTPGATGWYANKDYNQFLREENNQGRREFVLFDAQGPGAMVRFWSTLADYKGRGILRFYIDGNPTPVIEGDIISVLGKNAVAGYPFSSAVSEKAIEMHRAYNLYFPIAYSASCKITYESDAIYRGEILYYNIGYREYGKETKVKSFQKSDLAEYSKEIEKSRLALLNHERGIPAKAKIQQSKPQSLVPTGQLTEKLKGKSAIRKIEVKLSAAHYEQALRSTVLKISFDGQETVWVPVGDFFGTGYILSPYRSWYTEVSADSVFSCYWVMPFQKTCEVTMENCGKEDVRINRFHVTASPWKWTAQTMYFGAGWYELYQMRTRRNGDYFDLNLATLDGEGVLVGTGLTVYDAVGIWWGEGDEKIYVDGENFPSTFGTGTEDYFGYAWCRYEPFQHPFVAQPFGEGNNRPGMTSNIRYRSLDGIPFRKKLRFDLEMWHWSDTKINFAPVSFYYLKPGGRTNLRPQPAAVTNPVALTPSDVVNNQIGRDGYVEFEAMDYKASGGNIERQSIEYIFSYNTQAWWKNAGKGDKAEFSFISDREGTYYTKIRLTVADDYSQIRLYVNGKVCLEKFDAYNDKVDTRWVELGELVLKKGTNMVVVEITGKNPLAKGEKNMCGLDCLVLESYQ